MNLVRELRILGAEVDEYGVEPEHMDRLVRIAEAIIGAVETDAAFVQELSDFRDYFERWGVCSDTFNAFFGSCLMYAAGWPENAVIEATDDDGEPEVSSRRM